MATFEDDNNPLYPMPLLDEGIRNMMRVRDGEGVVGIREELALLTPSEFEARVKRNDELFKEYGKMISEIQQKRARTLRERRAMQQVCTHKREDGSDAIILEHETQAQSCIICGWQESIYTLS